MELIRLVVASVAGLLLTGGYLASVSAFFSGTTENYSQRIDQSPVPILALVLLLATVVLMFVPDRTGQEEGDES